MLSTQAGLFNKGRANVYLGGEGEGENVYVCFPSRELGVDVVNSLVICAIYRAWPYQNPPDYSVSVWIFILRISSQLIESSLKGSVKDVGAW